MKLTNTIRDAFVRAVMDDTPSVDYSEKIRAAAVKAAVAALPQKVAALWKDSALRHYVKTVGVHVPGCGVRVPSGCEDSYTAEFKALEKLILAECASLTEAHVAQKQARENLRSKLRHAAYAYTTRKALAAALPEFEKYLPADEAAALRTVPVIANVVADFVKAGWPKDAKKKAVPA